MGYSCLAGSIKDINELGINEATFNTMHRCLDALLIKPSHILVDGTTWKDYKGENSAEVSLIPKGDDTYTSIAAAAIIAKVRRDEYMLKLDELFPSYNWKSNKGYLSPEHISALKEIGPTKYHRKLYIRNFVNVDTNYETNN